ncbi:HrpB1 family type III secretion system apparatus protein [Paraburkholderia sp. B3]|uniref:HrpB1 family type III secretion system apparatus protein n=1 Tax=Paraburkholderia sp. B3 TaxID=3134791 RepID=UPI0039821CE3
MYTSKPEYLSCSADVVGGLIETVSVALMDQFPKPTVDCDDVALMLDALHVLRPDAPELDALDGILFIVKGAYDDAIHVLRQVTESAPHFAYARALLAFSLAAKGDPEWRQCAGEVIDDHESGDAQKLVRVLIARHDLMDARRASRLGGEFVMPASVTSLLEDQSAPPAARDADAGHPAPREPVSADAHYMGFLRA